MKTRTYLAAIVLTVLVPLLGLSAWGLNLLLEKEKEARLQTVEARANSIALSIDKELVRAEGALRVIGQTELMAREDFPSLYLLMRRTITSPDSWAVLYDAGGRMLMHSHHPYGMNFDEGPDNWVRPAIELPLYAGQETQARLPHDAARGHAEPVPLMIVDDNVDAARTLASLLEAKGHQVTVMANARSALDDSVRKPLPLYILDIGLPDIDGHELARRLRAFSPTSGAVLVALTGYGQVHDQAMALAAGFDHHFVKPIDIAALDRILVEVAQARQTVCG